MGYSRYSHLSTSCVPAFGGTWFGTDHAGIFRLYMRNSAIDSYIFQGCRLTLL